MHAVMVCVSYVVCLAVIASGWIFFRSFALSVVNACAYRHRVQLCECDKHKSWQPATPICWCGPEHVELCSKTEEVGQAKKDFKKT